jgi:hypothetical protein
MQIMKIEGLPVKDAKTSVVLRITDGDVKKGRVKNPLECAAALACRRQLGASEAQVHVTRTYVRFNGGWTRYITPAALRSEIVAFDRGGRFEPGDYILKKMAPSKKKWRKTGPKLKKGKKRLGYHRIENVRPMATVS